MLPLIGITTYGRGEVPTSSPAYAEHYCSPTLYVDSVRRAGGVAILLPSEEPNFERWLKVLDGIIFSGGADIDPNLYGGNPHHPELGPIFRSRDTAEIAFANAALRRKTLPLLFVCRGMQLLNVVQGGTLHEHIEDLGNGDVHRCPTKFWAQQPVEISKGTRLYSAVQRETVQTMSGHHQGIRELGSELNIGAIAEDGIIEAIEHREHPFAVGVQWHPEVSSAFDPDQQRLIDFFVSTAAGSALRAASSVAA